ncbi:MAG TPA: nucleotide disphospho-sugar-binding domain-containing protein [Ferruginibacter sp.]|nr:nucleotide disphospho-sugar-binding domain-containing protein [Ferruginibacter sp.]
MYHYNFQNNATRQLRKGAKILFANFPGDGHFNPLTGLAAHLTAQGYDVRWYTSTSYEEKIKRLGIPFYPFKKAVDITGDKVIEMLPEREKYRTTISRLNFDIINVFIRRGPEYYHDILDIYKSFPFELMIADIAFTGIPFVKDLMNIPVAGVGVFPLTARSKDLPPAGLGMTPSYSFFGRLKQQFLRYAAKHFLFAKSNKVMHKVFEKYGIESNGDSVFDELPQKCDMIFQTGTPGFEYRRSDLDKNVKFMGPLLPFTGKTEKHSKPWYDERLSTYKKTVLVTQGTVEKDSTKLLVPTLEALRGTDYLVVVTTGGSDTEKLRRQYAAPNVIIEDFIPFGDIMPYADVYITNGGMGGVLLSIENELPMIAAGVHEGKNEICARIGYFNLGVNLETERPNPGQILKGVEEVTGNRMYRKNVIELNNEFSLYDPFMLCEKYVKQLLPNVRAFMKKNAA